MASLRSASSSSLIVMSLCLISQGAEAHVYTTAFCGRACVLKRRVPKAYRHPSLDAALQASRTLSEARMLARCRRLGISTPTVYHVDVASGSIFMEHVPGRSFKQFVVEHSAAPTVDGGVGLSAAVRDAAAALGRLVAVMHGEGVIHGDLTSSNVIVRPQQAPGDALVLTVIDFGLGYSSNMVEDKAVDLYVLERALASTHASLEPALFEAFRAAYAASAVDAPAVLKKFEQVKSRGRKKVCFG